MANSKNNSVDEDRDLVDFAVRIWNKTMSEPYYVFHFLLFFSYIPIRCAASNVISPSRASLLLRRVIIHDFCIFVFVYGDWTLNLIVSPSCFVYWTGNTSGGYVLYIDCYKGNRILLFFLTKFFPLCFLVQFVRFFELNEGTSFSRSM